MTSTEISHENDYAARHGNPQSTHHGESILPPEGMCFLCRREPVLAETILCLGCNIKADLQWVGYQKLGAA